MALTEQQIIDAIAEQNGFTRKKSTEAIESILELIKSTLTYMRDNKYYGKKKEKEEIKG